MIKTHHNDTALVRLLRDQGRIIEPLKDYHKDEVCLPRCFRLPRDARTSNCRAPCHTKSSCVWSATRG